MTRRTRAEILTDLITYNGDLNKLRLELSDYSWDIDEPVVTMNFNQLTLVLNSFLNGEQSSTNLEDWANSIECREDLDFEDELISEIIFQIANPVLHEAINYDSIKELLDLIRKNTEVKEELSDSILAGMNSFKGQKLQGCFRKFYDDHNDVDSEDNLDQELDGDTFIVFSDKTVTGFYTHSEVFSLKIGFNATLENIDAINISGNLFWRNKIDNDVVDIQLLNSEYRSNPYGVKFILSNDTCFEIVYVSESDCTFDALVIRDCAL